MLTGSVGRRSGWILQCAASAQFGARPDDHAAWLIASDMGKQTRNIVPLYAARLEHLTWALSVTAHCACGHVAEGCSGSAHIDLDDARAHRSSRTGGGSGDP